MVGKSAAQAPDWPPPAPRFQITLKLRFVCGDCDYRSASNRRERFSQVSGGENAIAPIGMIQQKDIDVASKLPVLKSVVQNVRR